MSDPQAGTGTETYIIPTVTVPPASGDAKGVGGITLEATAEIGTPLAGGNNISDVLPGAAGSVRDASTAQLPLTIEIMDTGAVPKESSASQLTSRPLPRFSVQFSASGGRNGLAPNFAWPPGVEGAINTYVPIPKEGASENGTNDLIIDADTVPAVIEDDDGILRVFYIARDASASDYRIIAYAYDQSTGATVSWARTVAADRSNLLSSELGRTISGLSIAACRLGRVIYLAVVEAGDNAASPPREGEVWLFAYRSDWADPRVRKVAGPLASFASGASIIADGGVTLSADSDGGVTIVLGALLNDRGTPRRAIYSARLIGARQQIATDKTAVSWVEIGSFTKVYPGDIRAVAFSPDGVYGWAVGNFDGVLYTENSGGSWTLQTNGITDWPSLYTVAVAGPSPDDSSKYYVWAGGNGAIIRSRDSGLTWEEMPDMPAAFVRSFVFKDVSTGWYATYDATTDDRTATQGSSTLYLITDAASDSPGTSFLRRAIGDMRQVAIWEASTNTILVAGFFIPTDISGATHSQFMKIPGATSADATPVWATLSENPWAIIESVAVAHDSGGAPLAAYAVTSNGMALQYDTGDSLTVMNRWWYERQVFASIAVVVNNTEIIVAGVGRDRLFLSHDGLRSSQEFDLSGVTGTQKTVAAWVSSGSVSIIAAGTEGIGQRVLSNRAYPVLAPDGAFFVVANMLIGSIEVWRRTAETEQFIRVADPGATLSFTAQTGDPTTISGTIARPAVIEADSHIKYLLADSRTDAAVSMGKHRAVASRDGQLWIGSGTTSDSLPLPLPYPLLDLAGTRDTSDGLTAEQVRRTFSAVAYGGGRLFSFITSDGLSASPFDTPRIACRTARYWTASSTEYMPVLTDQRQWLGIDDMRITWPGTPVIGDTWTLPIRYLYPISHLFVDSPSTYWRTADINPNYYAGVVELVWSRENLVSVLGAGRSWDISACAVFGSNMPYMLFDVAVANYGGTGFPTSANDYIRFILSAVVDSGIPRVAAIPGGPEANILIDRSKTWTPNQFAPGYQQYYLALPLQSTIPATYTVRKILGNTEDSIHFEGNPIAHATGNVPEYLIYSDRAFSDGTGGIRGQTVTDVSLLDSGNNFTRYVRLVIPKTYGAQYRIDPTEGYIKIGTVILGRHAPVSVRRPIAGKTERARFAPFRWQLLPNVVTDTTRSGISSVRHFGRPRRQLTLPYDSVEAWQAQMMMSGLAQKLHQAFAFIPDSNSPNPVLVRLNRDPEFINTVGDEFSSTIQLIEVT